MFTFENIPVLINDMDGLSGIPVIYLWILFVNFMLRNRGEGKGIIEIDSVQNSLDLGAYGAIWIVQNNHTVIIMAYSVKNQGKRVNV